MKIKTKRFICRTVAVVSLFLAYGIVGGMTLGGDPKSGAMRIAIYLTICFATAWKGGLIHG